MNNINIFENLNNNKIKNDNDEEEEEEEEDNNPFSGTNHMFASGMAGVPDIDTLSGTTELKPGYEYPSQQSAENNNNHKDTTLDNNDSPYSDDANLSTISSRTHSSSNSSDIDSHDFHSNSNVNSTSSNSQYEPYENLSLSVALAQQQNQENIMQDQKDWQIKIVESGNFNDQWGKHTIGYVIHYNDKEVIRRYSEFSSLHDLLVKFFPTIVVPPIPSKHSLMKYFLNPINAQYDTKVIEKRKRKFASFLNNCNNTPEIKSHIIFQKFLDPDFVWKDVIHSPPVTILPQNNLLAPPLNQVKPSPLHPLLPSPNTSNSPTNSQIMDSLKDNTELMNVAKEFIKIESLLSHYLAILQPIYNEVKHNKFHLSSLSGQFAELGAFYNALSIENLPFGKLSSCIEKVGRSYDIKYVSMEVLTEGIQNLLEENVEEIVKLLLDSRRVIVFKNMKLCQYQIVKITLQKRQNRLKELNEFEDKLNRLDMALNRDAVSSRTVATVVDNLKRKDYDNNKKNGNTNTNNNVESTNQPIESNNNSNEPDLEQIKLEQKHIQLQYQLQKKRKKINKYTSKLDSLGPEFLTKTERDLEGKRIAKEIEKLNECFKVIQRDIKEVNLSSMTSLANLLQHVQNKLDFMLHGIVKLILNYNLECLNAWKEAKSLINEM
ncbi:similar to Saccharomyces cerevisiae YDR425W SNX41 Sorting nexin, involved in the retrieval of late-Golgi SNAREs from the post-Golgi endosome to the trans-Golgi network [Maudiozyma saulgeensis]|uniref:Similar to Saccharomyces cerevisiae YDR425W SNX41 Sorting nexin, involved in the retrieval of late-Golgi SNAREs from the post-Golgi endosome to the trans-Golgi network n=1 Tax=Maudiozyma saulgeensis TaxID=1789683 RepID=A0A1X7QWJ0_9SACH|nr:similar to Saccharomyces cerevisiae YDR425W SNX41 Sorting nexin, involved in the retrieval of late-Golgi SNAREs from the post-Golgi endosome to the trans-Golgi network [Kazachstania saulgeensis]